MKIGYQLFSAIERCQGKDNLKETIRKVAEIGYDGVEFCSYEGISADEMRSFLKECGIEGFNAHVQLERWQADAQGEVRYASEAGIPYVTIPWVAPELRNKAGFDGICKMIPQIIEYCKHYGVKLLYHNHDFEFKKQDNKYILDIILDSDNDLGLELDTFWAHYAGVSPVDYMEKRRNELAMIHVKDYESFSGGGMAGGQEMPTFAAIGTGEMNNTPIINKANELGLTWVVVEQDNSKIDVLQSAKISFEALKNNKINGFC